MVIAVLTAGLESKLYGRRIDDYSYNDTSVALC